MRRVNAIKLSPQIRPAGRPIPRRSLSVVSGKERSGFPETAKSLSVPDWICNPVRNVCFLIFCRTGCPTPPQPCPAARTALNRDGRGCKPRPAKSGFLPDGVCNPVRNVFCRPAKSGFLPDGVCNPVRNVFCRPVRFET
jgi:hypothetical protein